ncbi:hypothetical protein [Streptomyces sp. NPDC088733]|uniref:hypothetical protein n=1 Tax=Streptomyces sp. NPDC088733 TaxID=3365880 RepID=UPI003829BAD6
MKAITRTNPQLAPVMAINQLITEFPHLRRMRWSLSEDGFLMGNLTVEEDARPLMAAYVAALGGSASETRYTTESGQARFSSWLHVVWRDVEFSVSLVCRASLAPESSAVAA